MDEFGGREGIRTPGLLVANDKHFPFNCQPSRYPSCKAPEAVVAALRKLGLPNDATNADVLAICLFKQGLEGSTFAIKEMREQAEGRLPFAVELLSHEEHEVNIVVSFEKNMLGARKPVERIIDVDQPELPAQAGAEEPQKE